MTFQEKQLAMLTDLLQEREYWIPDDWWKARLTQKINELQDAIGSQNKPLTDDGFGCIL